MSYQCSNLKMKKTFLFRLLTFDYAFFFSLCNSTCRRINQRIIWLNISHNEVPKMSARVFARVSVLRVLNLNSNKITSLDANSFRGMRFMRRLYFADNQISRVGRGAFKAVSRYVKNWNLIKWLFKDYMHLTCTPK